MCNNVTEQMKFAKSLYPVFCETFLLRYCKMRKVKKAVPVLWVTIVKETCILQKLLWMQTVADNRIIRLSANIQSWI